MERTTWQEFDINNFLYHLESIKYYENEMKEEEGRLRDMAKDLRGRHIIAVQRTIRGLKGSDFIAALNLVKETSPEHYEDICSILKA